MKLGPIPFVVAAFAGSLSAATYTVSQDGRGTYGSIQAAVDKAQPYDEVVILDSAIYNEQVTLRSPLHHFVLRASNPYSPRKPVIRWSDQVNVGPKTCQEGLDSSKITFDKNGALRLMDVRDVRIEGIAIDGAGPTPFVNLNVWGNGKDCTGTQYPLFHGNDALLVYRTSRAVVVGCEFTNAYFGVYIKDIESQGPFALRGNALIPPFAHMASGNHLFEGNSIHHNTWGVFMESARGLGSTFRDNLIYENHHATPAAAAAVKAMSSEGANQPSGAFFFKDVQYSSMTLQNNTFWHDYTLLAGGYRPGAQHLFVNNIIAEPNEAWSLDRSFPSSFMELSPDFPKRMKCNAFAGQAEIPSLKAFLGKVQLTDTVTGAIQTLSKTFYYSDTVRIMNGFPALKPDTASVPVDVTLSYGVQHTRISLPSAIYMGALLQDGASSTGFSAADQNRWVETRFKSLQPADADFLMPGPEFQEALDSGWSPLRYPEASGIPSTLGALPAGARPQALLRIVPLAPVLIESGQMVLRFTVQAVKGGPPPNTAAPVIAYLRLEKNVPANPLSFGGDPSLRLPEAEAIPIPAAPIRFGYNEVKLPPSGLSADSNALGFVEMAVQGMGTLSNVAQFPILPLAPLFTVEAWDETQDIPVSAIAPGKTFRLRIAYATKAPAVVRPIRISLASGAALKFMNPADLDSAGNIRPPLPFTAKVQFTETPDDGVDLIWASAYFDSALLVTGFGQSQALVFDGTPTFMAHGKGRAALKAADILKGRNVLGRKIGVKGR